MCFRVDTSNSTLSVAWFRVSAAVFHSAAKTDTARQQYGAGLLQAKPRTAWPVHCARPPFLIHSPACFP